MKKENLSELEQKFKAALDEGGKKIEEQLSIAMEAISKAEKISEEYGIPFDAGCSPLGQQYFPASYDKKWGKFDVKSDSSLDEDEDEEINLLSKFDLYRNDYDGVGWEHSAVC